jgi:hypothetical protein
MKYQWTRSVLQAQIAYQFSVISLIVNHFTTGYQRLTYNRSYFAHHWQTGERLPRHTTVRLWRRCNYEQTGF